MEATPRKRVRTGRLILLFILLALIVVQFIPVDRSTPDYDPAGDFLAQHDVPGDISSTLRMACYDCHSYETQYPWYSYIAPVSWWLQNHIDNGREHLNFSLWSNYSTKEMEELYEEAAHEVEGGTMPLKSYTWIHKDANLSEDQRARLVLFMSAQQTRVE